IAHQWPRATPFLMDERCHSLQIARGPAYQDDFGARCREGKGARPAQSPTSTRDDGYFPVQPHARHLEWRIVVLPHTSSSRHGAARSCLAYCIKSPGWRYAWKKPESSIRCLCKLTVLMQAYGAYASIRCLCKHIVLMCIGTFGTLDGQRHQGLS